MGRRLLLAVRTPGLRLLVVAVLVVAWLAAAAVWAGDPLDRAIQGRQLLNEGRYAEAVTKLESALPEIRAAFGDEHVYVAYALDDLGRAELGRGRLDRARELAEEAVRIVRLSQPEDSVEHAILLANRGNARLAQGDLAAAGEDLASAHAILGTASRSADTNSITVARNLAIVRLEERRPSEALALFQNALDGARATGAGEALRATLQADLASAFLDLREIDAAVAAAAAARQLAAGTDPATRAEVEVVLSRTSLANGDLGRAEEAAARALTFAGSEPSLARAQALYAKGSVEILRREAVEAEKTFREVDAIYRSLVGETHPARARVAHELALVYGILMRGDDSRRYFERSIELSSAALGPASLAEAETRTEYAATLAFAGEGERAAEQAAAALAIFEMLGDPVPFRRALATNTLGSALRAQGDLVGATAALTEGTALIATLDGEHSPHLWPGDLELAEMAVEADRLAEAEPRLARAIATLERTSARTVDGLARAYSIQADLEAARGNHAAALAAARAASRIASERQQLAGAQGGATAVSEARQARAAFERHLRLLLKMDEQDRFEGEIVETAQLPHLSGTAASLGRMAARVAGRDARLDALAVEREASAQNYAALDQLLTEALAGSDTDDRVARLQQAFEEAGRQLALVDRQLASEFPAYAELTNPRPVALADLRAAMQPKEAIWVQVTDEGGTSLVMIRADMMATARTTLTTATLEQEVRSLRTQLDPSRFPFDWRSKPPPFDLNRAHALYRDLLGPFEAELQGVEHLVMVVDGALQSLPPGLLVRRLPHAPPMDHPSLGQVDWLIRSHAISVLPSAGGLVSLRRLAPASRAPQPFLGYGDPLFVGPDGSNRSPAVETVLAADHAVDLRRLTKLPRLPDTRTELEQIAASLGATNESLRLGDRATETEVKRSPLDEYRVIAFATHGLLASETSLFLARAEPALALTPPPEASFLDDGLLTASEVARLTLDADWVLLAACNTASPSGAPGSDGLSGLARAFFYAGARSLLVSHWYVETTSAAAITAGTMSALGTKASANRAGALRHSILQILDGRRERHWTHPALWAPFTLVGDGGGRA